MAIKCAWASMDERGKASGGKVGDQTGKEVKVGNWYSFGQNVILRPKKTATANKIAKAMKYWANSEKVGYDQGNRLSLYNHLKGKKFRYDSVTSKVETDCSAMVACAVNCAGITVSGSMWTGNMVECLKATGEFKVLRGSKYLISDSYIKKGDIILNEKSHVIVALEDGAKVD